MKTFNVLYENYHQLSKYVQKNGIDRYKSILVQVFLGRNELEFAKILISELKKILPQATIIGATTAGEILDCKVLSNTTVISFSVFKKTSLKTVRADTAVNDFKLGEQIAQKLVTSKTKLLLVFGNALTVNGSDMLEGIESVGSHYKVAGGHAGDNGYFKSTFVFNEEGITEKGVVGVALDSDVLNVFSEYSLCWQELGKVMTVTKSHKNVVYEIDHMNIKEIYRKYLGEKVVNALPQSATEFPLIVIHDDIKVARCPIALSDDGSLKYIGNVEEGDRVLFSYGNIDMLLNRSHQLFTQVSSMNVESLFIYSCTARRVFMQEKIEDEFIPFKNIASVSGFFTYGEYFQTPQKRNVLLNITTTVLGLSEMEMPKHTKNKKNKSYKKANTGNDDFSHENFIQGKKEIIIEVLNNLVNAVTKELEDINTDLEKKNQELSKANRNLELYAKKIEENQSTLIEAEKAASLGHLAAGIAHNLRTPLLTSSGGLSIINDIIEKIKIVGEKIHTKTKMRDITDEMEQWCKEIRLNLDYMAEVIHTVSDQMSHAVGSRTTLFSIDELIAKTKILMSHELKRNRCRLKIENNVKDKIQISGNINDLVQAMNILVSNSIDAYAGKGGDIILRVSLDVQNVSIEIEDHASGVPKKIQDKIFKEMVTTKGKNGRGIGLYLLNSIIKGRFCGNIRFISTIGKGTSFIMEIPLS